MFSVAGFLTDFPLLARNDARGMRCDCKNGFLLFKKWCVFLFSFLFLWKVGEEGGVRGGFLEQISDDDDDDDDGDMLLRFFFVPETTLSYHRPF